MNLFMDTPRPSFAGEAFDPAPAPAAPSEPAGQTANLGNKAIFGGAAAEAPQAQRRACGQSDYSAQQDSYRKELAYGKKRARSRKLKSALRILLLIVAVPVLLVLVFLGSYVFTCILDGATPDEVVQLLGVQLGRAQNFIQAVA